jgi:hypothetical protein
MQRTQHFQHCDFNADAGLGAATHSLLQRATVAVGSMGQVYARGVRGSNAAVEGVQRHTCSTPLQRWHLLLRDGETAQICTRVTEVRG